MEETENSISCGNIPTDTVPMTEEEIKKALNVPQRDTESYPEIEESRKLKGGSFLYKMNLLASGADGNLQSLVWELYDRMDDYIHLRKENSVYPLMQTLEDLQTYISEHGNIIFDNVKIG